MPMYRVDVHKGMLSVRTQTHMLVSAIACSDLIPACVLIWFLGIFSEGLYQQCTQK